MKTLFFNPNAEISSENSMGAASWGKRILLLTLFFLVISSGKSICNTIVPDENPGNTKTNKSVPAELPTFEFWSVDNTEELTEVPKEMAEKHFLGEAIGAKLYLFESKYTYQAPVVPGNPQTRTVIRKPLVYEAVKKIERNLKKRVKSGELEVNTASNDFSKVLDVAFSVLSDNTTEFEKAIDDAKDINALATLFVHRVKLLS